MVEIKLQDGYITLSQLDLINQLYRGLRVLSGGIRKNEE